MASLRQCSRCGCEHELPVGKKCKRALSDTQATQAVDTLLDAADDQVAGGADDHVSSLVSVISQLVTRMDSQQEQLNHLQAAMANSSVVSRPWLKVKVPYLSDPVLRRFCQGHLKISPCRL
jgi:hypothetical protein